MVRGSVGIDLVGVAVFAVWREWLIIQAIICRYPDDAGRRSQQV